MSRFRQKRSADPLEAVREKLEAGQPYEAMQFTQSFLARKADKISADQAMDLVCSTLQLLLQRAEHACGADLVAWSVGRYQLTAEHVQRVLDIARSGDSQANVSICLALQKTNFPELSRSIHARLGSAYAELQDFSAANRWLLKSGDVAAYADMIVAWAAHGYPSEKYMFGVRAVLHLMQAGKVDEAAELKRLLSEKDHWDVAVAPECRLCEMLFDLKAVSAAVFIEKGVELGGLGPWMKLLLLFRRWTGGASIKARCCR